MKRSRLKERAASHTDKPQKEPEEENADDRRAVKKKPQEQPEYEGNRLSGYDEKRCMIPEKKQQAVPQRS